MIPVLVDAGYRVIAMDHLGMGRSDKPTEHRRLLATWATTSGSSTSSRNSS